MEDFKVKPELLEKFKVQMGMNCLNSYSFAVVRAVIDAMETLDAPAATPEMATSLWGEIGITGYQAGAAAQMISHFHVRGEEFRVWWNKKYGVEGEGVVNPAIVTLSVNDGVEEKKD